MTGIGKTFYEYIIDSPPSDQTVEEIEFEIVGVFDFFVPDNIEAVYYSGSYIYIPDSCLPQGFEILSFSPILEDFGWIEDVDFIPQHRYSFVLKNAGEEAAFLDAHGDELDALGYSVSLIESGYNNFKTSADPIIRATLSNFILFTALIVFVALVVVFLYLQQRKKDFAIMRALGNAPSTRDGWLISRKLGGCHRI